MKKVKDVRKIFLNENWISNFYYIREVLNSCKTPKQALAAHKWGINILYNKRDFIMKKYELTPSDIYEVTSPYIDEIDEMYYTGLEN